MTHKTRKRNNNKHNIFTEKDYNSNEGFLTSIWGNAAWHFLHTISFNYPTSPSHKDKINYRNFILNLKNVLPCKLCRENLSNNLKEYPLTIKEMKNRETFSKYIYNLHEIINTMLCKKSNLTYEQVRERYEHFRAKGCSTNKHDLNETNHNNHNNTKKKKEKGCIKPMHGKKSKCVITIVPQETKCKSFQINEK